MIDWYSFLDPKFAICKSKIKRRDRVVAVCSQCGYRSVVIVNNLIVQIQRLGTHICFSCSAKRGSGQGRKKREKTMLEKYGAANPQQIQTFKEKRKNTLKKKQEKNKQLKEVQNNLKKGENYKKLIKEVLGK